MQPSEIIQELKAKGWKGSQISKEAGISSPSLYKIEKGGDCRFRTVERLRLLLDTDPPVNTRRSAKQVLRLIVHAKSLEEAVKLAQSAL